MSEEKLKTDLIQQLVNEQKEKIKQYEKGDSLLQKIADGRIKIKEPLTLPKPEIIENNGD